MALMTQVHGLTTEEINSYLCTPDCQATVKYYRSHNSDLVLDLNDLKRQNNTLKKNEKLFKEKIESQRKDISKLKEDLSVKCCVYKDARETINVLTKELEEIKQRFQTNELNIKRFDASSKLGRDICNQQFENKQRKKGSGLGYNNVSPPFNHNYTYLPVSEEELIKEQSMSYGPKTNEVLVNSDFVEKRTNQQMNFVQKGVEHTNASSSLADEIVVEDVSGDEQDIVSDKNSDNFDPDGTLFLQILSNMCVGPHVLGKTFDSCGDNLDSLHVDDSFSANNGDHVDNSLHVNTSKTNCDHLSELVSKGLSDVTISSEISETLSQNDQEIILEKEVHSESKPEKDLEKTNVLAPEDNSFKEEKHQRSEFHTCASSDKQIPSCSEHTHESQAKLSKNAKPFRPNRSANIARSQCFPILKRQTCFNCGIPGHIARNCVHHQTVQKSFKQAQHQKVMHNRQRYFEPMKTPKSKAMRNNYRKAKPSDQDWNATKLKNQNRQSGFQNSSNKSFERKGFYRSHKYWKPKNNVAQSSPSHSTANSKRPLPLIHEENFVWRKVSFVDANGKPKSSMAWVPKNF